MPRGKRGGWEHTAALLLQQRKRLETCIAQALKEQKSGRLLQAANIYESVLTSDPNDAQVLIRYGIMLMGQDKLDRAADLLQRAALCDSPAKVHAQRACEALKAKQAAVEQLQKADSEMMARAESDDRVEAVAQSCSPDSSQHRVEMSRFCSIAEVVAGASLVRDLQEAIEDTTTTVMHHRTQTAADSVRKSRLTIAELLEKNAPDHVQAERHSILTAAAKVNNDEQSDLTPVTGSAQDGASVTAQEGAPGSAQEGAPVTGSAQEGAGERTDRILSIGINAQQLGNEDDAANIYEHVLASDPNHAQVLIRYGIMLMGQDKLDRAAELLQRAALCDSPAKVHAQRAYEALKGKQAAVEQRRSATRHLLTPIVLATGHAIGQICVKGDVFHPSTAEELEEGSSQTSGQLSTHSEQRPRRRSLADAVAGSGAVCLEGRGAARACAGCGVQGVIRKFCKNCGTRNELFGGSTPPVAASKPPISSAAILSTPSAAAANNSAPSVPAANNSALSVPAASNSSPSVPAANNSSPSVADPNNSTPSSASVALGLGPTAARYQWRYQSSGPGIVASGGASCPTCGATVFQKKFCRECGTQNAWFSNGPKSATAPAQVTATQATKLDVTVQENADLGGHYLWDGFGSSVDQLLMLETLGVSPETIVVQSVPEECLVQRDSSNRLKLLDQLETFHTTAGMVFARYDAEAVHVLDGLHASDDKLKRLDNQIRSHNGVVLVLGLAGSGRGRLCELLAATHGLTRLQPATVMHGLLRDTKQDFKSRKQALQLRLQEQVKGGQALSDELMVRLVCWAMEEAGTAATAAAEPEVTAAAEPEATAAAEPEVAGAQETTETADATGKATVDAYGDDVAATAEEIAADAADAVRVAHDLLCQSALNVQRAGDFETAASLYSEVLNRDPNHAQVLIRYGIMLMGQDKLDRAAELLQRAALCDSPAKVHAQRAYEALKGKQATKRWQKGALLPKIISKMRKKFHFQSISLDRALKGCSVEELRWQHWQQVNLAEEQPAAESKLEWTENMVDGSNMDLGLDMPVEAIDTVHQSGSAEVPIAAAVPIAVVAQVPIAAAAVPIAAAAQVPIAVAAEVPIAAAPQVPIAAVAEITPPVPPLAEIPTATDIPTAESTPGTLSDPAKAARATLAQLYTNFCNTNTQADTIRARTRVLIARQELQELVDEGPLSGVDCEAATTPRTALAAAYVRFKRAGTATNALAAIECVMQNRQLVAAAAALCVQQQEEAAAAKRAKEAAEEAAAKKTAEEAAAKQRAAEAAVEEAAVQKKAAEDAKEAAEQKKAEDAKQAAKIEQLREADEKWNPEAIGYFVSQLSEQVSYKAKSDEALAARDLV